MLIVDDDPMVCVSMQTYLQPADDITVVAAHNDAKSGIAYVREHLVDVVLMDVRMPALTGIEATPAMLAARPGIKVVLLTTFDEDDYVLSALRAGAAGFMLKDVRPEALVEAVRLAHRDGYVLSARPARRLNAYLPSAKPAAEQMPDLTERELEVLTHLCAASSNAEIAQAMHLSESTVKAYVSTVIAKLGCESRLKAVVTAFEAGLVPLRR